jgi:Flp pilus assembly protein TadG
VSTPTRDRGQATVEFALALPLVLMVVLGIVQIVVVVRDQIAVELAARDGARAAAVSAAPDSAAAAAAHAAITLRPIDVATTTSDRSVVVVVRHANTTDVPIIGAVLGDIELSASVTMLRDPP